MSRFRGSPTKMTSVTLQNCLTSGVHLNPGDESCKSFRFGDDGERGSGVIGTSYIAGYGCCAMNGFAIYANSIWQCVPLHGHQERHLLRRQLVRAAIVGRDALFWLSCVRLLLLKQVEFIQAPVARLRALVGLIEVGGFVFAGKREGLFIGVLWGIGKNNPGLAVDHVANIGVQNELFNKFSDIPSSRFGGVGHVIPFQSFTGNLALVSRFTSRMKAPQPEIHGKSACCYISVRQHSPKYARVTFFPASLTKLILGAFRGLIADVYRCTMYSINRPRQFCTSVAESADGSKSLSWLKSPGRPGLSIARFSRSSVPLINGLWSILYPAGERALTREQKPPAPRQSRRVRPTWEADTWRKSAFL